MLTKLTIRELIDSKIQAVQSELISYQNSSYINSFSEIDICPQKLGRIIFYILKDNTNKKIILKSSNCSQFYHISFCYMVCNNPPLTTNGLTPSTPPAFLSNRNKQVSSIITREFEDLLDIAAPSSNELHLRIPLVSSPHDLSLAQVG